MNLRTKIGHGLGGAAILPILLGAGTAVFLVLSGLDSASRRDAARSARVALNLILRQAQIIESEAGEIASDGVLADLLVRSPGSVEAYLRTQDRSGTGMFEIADIRGKVVARQFTIASARAR